LDAVKKDWEKGAKPLTPEQTARIKGNGKADALYSTGMAGIDTRNLQASQAGVWGDALAGNYGRMLASGAGSFGGAAGVAGSLAGDIGGGLARAGGWQKQAEGAAQTAGNEHARAGIMKGAEAQGDAMNLQNAARSGELADSAIAADSAFESGMQGIDASGIEGSGNMERNLKYGKSRSEAARDMEHAMTGQEAQGLGDSLVQSFDDLSQSKAGATQTAFSGSLAGLSAGLTEQYRQTGAELAGLQPSHLDETQVNEAALLAAEQNPAPGEEPGAQAPAEADVDMANRQTVMDEEARMAEQTAAAQAREQTAPEPPEAPAAPEPPQAPAANAQDHYNALEAFLRVKVRSRDELAGKMAELGIDDTDLQQKIQQATVSGSGWRDRLKAALGAG
jgi:chemotaxis protein histidine kinase CheA